LEAVFAECYADAIAQASAATGLPENPLPAVCLYPIDAILVADFLGLTESRNDLCKDESQEKWVEIEIAPSLHHKESTTRGRNQFSAGAVAA
jgi:hypothetical protein